MNCKKKTLLSLTKQLSISQIMNSLLTKTFTDKYLLFIYPQ